MNTWLQLVSSEAIAQLRAEPASINALNQPEDATFSTYFIDSICFFGGAGSDADGEDSPLRAALSGFEDVDADTLENGSFGLVLPPDVERVLRALKAVDPKSVAERVKQADPEELEEAEVFDFDILTEGDQDPGELLNQEIARLTKFYEQALKSGLGVAMYTQ